MGGVMNQLLSHLKLRQDWYSFQSKIQGLTVLVFVFGEQKLRLAVASFCVFIYLYVI